MTQLREYERTAPLVAHVLLRFGVGGLENGLVNLLDYMPKERYRHAIICIRGSTEFKNRIAARGVRVIELKKAAGHDLGVYQRFWRVLRDLNADIVHTRNLAALEFQFIATLAGIKGRIHGEHGRDMYDLDGRSWKYGALRKAMRPFVHHYTAVSRDLEGWLVDSIGIDRRKVTQIYNGVRADRFCVRQGPRRLLGPPGFMTEENCIIGTVGRMEAVKDQLTLVRAFVHLLKTDEGMEKRLRLVIIGDGSLRQPAVDLLRGAGIGKLAWLPGERENIPELMQSMDIFVLPSLREGISNTILEAMATGLPVVATQVGGNPELVVEDVTGTLISPSDPVAMADAIRRYILDDQKRFIHGRNGLRRIELNFGMEAMVAGYLNVYDTVMLGRKKSEPVKDRRVARYSVH